MCSVAGIGLGLSAMGSIQSGMAAKAQGDAAKSAHDLSADLALQAAGDAVYRGTIKENQVAMHGAAVEAEARVQQSGSGADVNVGGPSSAQRATRAITMADRAMVRRNAQMEAYGLKLKARSLFQEGENAQTAGNNRMVGTFLSGIGGAIGQGGKLANDMPPGDDSPPAFPASDITGDGTGWVPGMGGV